MAKRGRKPRDARRGWGTGTVFLRGGVWYARWTDDAGQRSVPKSTGLRVADGNTKTDAIRWLNANRGVEARHGIPPPDVHRTRLKTLKPLVIQYYEKKPHSPRAAQTLERVLDRILAEAGETFLDKAGGSAVGPGAPGRLARYLNSVVSG